MTNILAIVCNRFREDYTLEGHFVQIPTKPAVGLLRLLPPASRSGGLGSMQADPCGPPLQRWIAHTGEELLAGGGWAASPAALKRRDPTWRSHHERQRPRCHCSSENPTASPLSLEYFLTPLTQLTPPWSLRLAFLWPPLLPSPLQSFSKTWLTVKIVRTLWDSGEQLL